VNYLRLLIIFSCLVKFTPVLASPENLGILDFSQGSPKIVYANNLNSEGKSASQKKKVLLLYVSRPDCPFCERLKNDVLHPLIKGKRLDSKILIREISLEDNSVIGFDNQVASAKAILGSYGIEGTPTLLFLDENGFELSQKLSGYSSQDYYWSYFEKAIARARTRLMKELR
jgi:thioredoxin-related protein